MSAPASASTRCVFRDRGISFIASRPSSGIASTMAWKNACTSGSASAPRARTASATSSIASSSPTASPKICIIVSITSLRSASSSVISTSVSSGNGMPGSARLSRLIDRAMQRANAPM
eukprot:Amastigsp_a6520_24.p3 type:complete len:118 gc:universal Amastigsp_a6520_24:756-403(-)